ncbi:MAG TPA: crosslink repair DNA glycosylase YcaQ family protein [Fimbriimonas sp.]|nr:crosslink repair DNA glycosylase YcaQ family protein [Fimbriimonas sp.]
MPALQFSKEQARTMLLAVQGFCEPLPDSPGAGDVLECIRRMGVLQIDTIHVVARSPYLVLWSRLGCYDAHLLDGLLSSGRLFEYWSHEACFIPIEQYPLYRRIMLEGRKHTLRFDWLAENREKGAAMLAHIRENGEARSSDFERKDGKSGNWWNWKDEKLALDMLHTAGDLMIARRERFQRVYDLRERVHPAWTDSQAPPLEEVVERQVEQSVRCLGVASSRWIPDYFRLKVKPTAKALEALVGNGAILPAQIEGVPDPCFIHSGHLSIAARVLEGTLAATRTVVLSPFDPIVWDRKRASELFGFDYRIECYTPAPKRTYGYFVLPILHKNRLIGRLDAKAHRKEGVFEVKTLHFEPDVKPDDEMLEALGATLQRCAKWHHTPKVRVSNSSLKGTARAVQASANRRRP